MRRFRLPVLALLLCGGALASEFSNCAAPAGDQITGRDVAQAVPALATLPPDLKLGYAPAPGAQRTFRVVQLQQLAKTNGIAAEINAPLCFAWPTHVMQPAQLQEAMKKSLAGRQVELDIADFSRFDVPDGELFFPLTGLSTDSDKPATWTGYVKYAGTRRFTIWARVKVTISQKQVVASRPLAAGERLDSSMLREEDYHGPLRHLTAITNEEEALGKITRWTLAAGAVLASDMLDAPLDVAQREIVTVRIDSGAAHVETQGIATQSGRRGDVIAIRNPKTGRVFRARIEDQGIVTVVPGGTFGLVGDEDTKS